MTPRFLETLRVQLLSAYDRVTRPLSPYKARQDLPAFGLLYRVDDDSVTHWPRVVFMALWSVVGAGGALMLDVITRTLPSIAHAYLRTSPAWFVALVVAAMLFEKLAGVVFGRYAIDVLDWLCDVGAWGTLGAYLYVCAFLIHETPRASVLLVLLVVWLVTYPWSTPVAPSRVGRDGLTPI